MDITQMSYFSIIIVLCYSRLYEIVSSFEVLEAGAFLVQNYALQEKLSRSYRTVRFLSFLELYLK